MKCDRCLKEYDGSRCPYCEGIPVVTASTPDNERKNKKMEVFLIVAAVIIVIAIIITVAVTKNKKDNVPTAEPTAGDVAGFLPESDEADTTPVTFTEDITVSFEGVDEDYADALFEHATNSATTVAFKPEVQTTRVPPTTKPAKPQVSTTKYLEETTVMTENTTQSTDIIITKLKAFFSGRYYIDGTMISGGEKTPLEMAMNGDDFQVYSEMDGKDIAIMKLDGNIYLMNPDTKKYTELNASVRKMMGINEESFSFSFNNMNINAETPDSVTECTYKGNKAVCYKYIGEKNHIEFIAVGDEVVQMILYNPQGGVETVVDFDEFTAGYPDDMLTFKGYSKTNMISFISSMM